MKLLLFSAPWCGQCKAYHPIVDKFIKSHPQLELEEINVEEDEELAEKYKIKNLPTTIILDNDKEISRSTGILNNSQLEKLII